MDRTKFSFEVFPPRKDMPVDVIYNSLDQLSDLNPDFISVTCGAGGSSTNASARMIEIAAAEVRINSAGAFYPSINGVGI